MKNESIQSFADLGLCVRENEPLAPHSSFHIGGAASLALFPKNERELIAALECLKNENPVVVGRGTNLVFPDEGLARPVIFTEQLRELTISENRILGGAGVSLTTLCRAAAEASLSGLEFAYGIPGSLGGAIYMNAGAFGGEIGSLCRSVRYYDGTGVRTLAGADCRFSYRKSFFSENKECVILSAELILTPGNREAIEASMKEIMAARKEKQPLEYPSAGSAFKRPKGFFAAKLIEDCGLKGLRVGDAEVSSKHAGFLVNRGKATAKDVGALVKTIREAVFAKTGVLLEPEIEFL